MTLTLPMSGVIAKVTFVIIRLDDSANNVVIDAGADGVIHALNLSYSGTPNTDRSIALHGQYSYVWVMASGADDCHWIVVADEGGGDN